jgi:hypothetical protein
MSDSPPKVVEDHVNILPQFPVMPQFGTGMFGNAYQQPGFPQGDNIFTGFTGMGTATSPSFMLLPLSDNPFIKQAEQSRQ